MGSAADEATRCGDILNINKIFIDYRQEEY
jgi:hypothetical protein